MDSNSVDELTDEPLSQEIKLLGDFVVAASRVARHLTQDEVDQVLELDPTSQDPRDHPPGQGS